MRVADMSKPPRGEQRGFVHKRIIGGIKGLLGGGPTGAIQGFFTSGGRSVPGGGGARPTTRCDSGFETPRGECIPVSALQTRTPRRFDPLGIPKLITRAVFPRGKRASLRCDSGFEQDGVCLPLLTFPGADLPPPNGGPVAAAAVAGAMASRSFGPGGFEPELFATTTRRCGRGAVLAVDGLCYNRRDVRNSERMWPRGRRPLLTGGEMRCISIASSAAKKLQRKQKQLQELGLLPKPSRSRAKKLPAGHVAKIAHG